MAALRRAGARSTGTPATSRLEEWCADRGLVPIPTAPPVAARYVASLADNLKIASIRRRAFAISQKHQERGLEPKRRRANIHRKVDMQVCSCKMSPQSVDPVIKLGFVWFSHRVHVRVPILRAQRFFQFLMRFAELHKTKPPIGCAKHSERGVERNILIPTPPAARYSFGVMPDRVSAPS